MAVIIHGHVVVHVGLHGSRDAPTPRSVAVVDSVERRPIVALRAVRVLQSLQHHLLVPRLVASAGGQEALLRNN